MENRSVSAIICEFNPLHSGHERAIRFASMDTKAPVVCILSGNFVQRGEPALYDKWHRAEAALRCGADLVVELPLPWAMSGAENFARGGAALAAALGCSHLVFGSECGDIDLLTKTAVYLNSEAFSNDLHSAPAEEQTLPFAKRRELVLERALGAACCETIRRPNNTLAVEYCKAIEALQLPLQPITLAREGAQHDGAAEGDSASASALREYIRCGDFASAEKYMPEAAASVFRNAPTASLQQLEKAIFYHLRTTSTDELLRITDVGEGIENRISEAAGKAGCLDELYDMAKSKRYSHARIRRIVLSSFLGLRRTEGLPPYIRVLGMKQSGAALLQGASLPVLTRTAELRAMPPACRELFALESRADDIYALAFEKNKAAGTNQRHGLILL